MTLATLICIFVMQVFASFLGVKFAVWLDERKYKKKAVK